ncbi:pirin family protein [Corynebacterium sp. 153RC1]|uniref:pirin family protein n=1 Tax=Corynebacterium TaxID=1716 RepID=UPI00211CF993|nr:MULTISPECIES: pirin family protein [unclassified Corynebacterium]MCQ9371103.1 pirin family protein [Corynebacterium sp. 35RC1]MCQ9343224.1 pirin family protein [Corynebacterium sp. 76QC2CO]MCQ9353041.1 pirin family protein [Corynebacterium sp. 209RC1]MCQ9355465.1 pirin family protein [Corynebacterium sp. 1222RC1]MCQ9357126.1 pirin family protein [Corynebacterium sp. 122RC1]
MTAVEIISPRTVPLGGQRAMDVQRTLPHRDRATIGAWCFADHYGPEETKMDVPPHPHTGLQTVSWLLEGSIKHDDSGDRHEMVRPGDLVIMTAGSGICHSEVSQSERLHGVQLWVVLPEHARHMERRLDVFHTPTTEVEGGEALVFLGSMLGVTSPVETHTPLLGAEVRIDPGASITLDLDPTYEHGILVDAGPVLVDGQGGTELNRHDLGYIAPGPTEVVLENPGPDRARVVVLGGTPFEEEFIMWWNFIGRTHEEIELYREEWMAHGDRFGTTHGYVGGGPDPLPAPVMPNARLKLRGGKFNRKR